MCSQTNLSRLIGAVWPAQKELFLSPDRMAPLTAGLSLTIRIHGVREGVMMAETRTVLGPRQYGVRLIDDTDFDL